LRTVVEAHDVLLVGVDVAREELDQVLSAVAADQSRASYYQRLLLTYLRDRAGIASSERRGDPVAEYGELRDQANIAVHDKLGASEVAALLTSSQRMTNRTSATRQPPANFIPELPGMGTRRPRFHPAAAARSPVAIVR